MVTRLFITTAFLVMTSNMLNASACPCGSHTRSSNTTEVVTQIEQKAPEQDIVSVLQNALKGDGTNKDYSNVKIHVAGGVITLMGSVESDQDKADIKSRIMKVEGTKNMTIIDAQLKAEPVQK